MSYTLFRSLCAAALLAAAAVPTANADAPEGVISAEFIPGWQTDRGTYMAGLHLRLAPGWKTYWRAPGDAGIPPRFDWAGSRNIAGAELHWPTPRVFVSNGLRTIGYENDVVLPIEITPQEAGRPMDLRGRVELGVCQDICMPLELSLTGHLPDAPRPAPIRAALADRPMSAGEAQVRGVRCAVEPISDGLRLTAEIDLPTLGGREAAVFELADPSIWISEADMTRDGDRLVARADLVPVSGQPFALDRSTVRITLLGESRAVDIRGCTGR
ncbi:Thiol-disulfide interchange protein, contains DsbC and DsbD domains [Rhodovulum sp. ES.010]|uniref:protein-disulfide reductase DsbD domain-containing protein n=1 Tax=Rhodovulum sp. ES.010 TaxID=1882821 RepID=UPI00092CD639|nr:protein-disulfide reductase DsbD domain-containing protein [Rhodovulum sp. ES.010]SIO46845.1 Thiol-disulfide interchange protein, contains DsbC and DsbD domains [Rhodovulum sp. ES.010]